MYSDPSGPLGGRVRFDDFEIFAGVSTVCGSCSVICSDNASTFRRAAEEHQSLFSATSDFCGKLATHLTTEGTKWSFIPPRAPHYGRLRKAAVRCFKCHFKRIVGSISLTFKEHSILTAEVQDCLNSRSVCPRSNDPNDLSELTPGHFSIDSPLKLPPEPLSEVLVMRYHFWMR